MSDSHKEPVVILAGGKGMRMREYSELLPKALVAIGPHPVILHVMSIYASHGFKRFIICLGYRGEKVKEYFMHHEWMSHDFTLRMGPSRQKEIKNEIGDFLDFEITFADTGIDTPTGGRLKMIERHVDRNSFLVTYCDTLGDIDVQALFDFHYRMKTTGTVTGVHAMSPFGILEVEETGLAKSFKEKPALPGYINGGFMAFKSNFFDYLSDSSILEEEPLMTIASTGQLAVYRHEGFWTCMDTFKDVERLNTLWEKGYMPHTGFRGKPPWLR